MKNIHVLPTDKQDFVIFKNRHLGNRLFHWNMDLGNHMNGLNYIGQNIYITSDEEIKDGDWYYLPKENKIAKCPKILKLHSVTPEWTQKIILTTDQDLIKDCVKAIDDEFLEWFVNNPSCEEVEIEKISVMNDRFKLGYKIIIPKEEAYERTTQSISLSEVDKQEDCYCTDECFGYLTKSCKRIEEPKQEWPESTGNILSDYAIGKSKAIQKSMHLDAKIAYRYMHKQETLEEAADNIFENLGYGFTSEKSAFINGYLECVKKMYSVEEVENILIEYVKTNPTKPYRVVSWFEQFKKK